MALVDMSETFQMTNVGDHIDGTDVYQSNRNLLDNPWFTVNQRSAGSTSDGYPADRWLKVGNTAATATATANGLVIALNGSGYCDLRNRYSKAEIITPNLGKTATISAMLADGTVFSDQIVLNTTQQNRYLNSGKIRFDFSVSDGVYLVRLVLYDDMTIRAVKLELGSVSTLANDAPPDYGTELLKCQRHCRVLSATTGGYVALGYAMSATNFRIQFPFAMRTAPNVSFSGTINLNGVNAVTAISSTGSFSDFVSLNITSSGLTTGSTYLLNITSGAKIILSADL